MDKWEKIGGALVRVGAPFFGRIGAFIAGALVTEGVAQEHADLFVNSLGAFAVLALDVCFVILKRRMAMRVKSNGIF